MPSKLGWTLVDKKTGELRIWHEFRGDEGYLIWLFKSRAGARKRKGFINQVVRVKLTWGEGKKNGNSL